MNLKRAATIGVAGAALAAWLAAAATSGRRDVPIAPLAIAQPVDARGEALAAEIARLHERLRPDAPPRMPGRNLFQFSAPRSSAVGSARAALTEAPVAAPAPLLPPLKLSGIAEDAGPDGPLRTAIISGFGQLFLVKEGESVTTRYRVSRISPDVVELTDAIDGSTLRLALK
jgi:hypothetical protein